jgi:hypothetical protein
MRAHVDDEQPELLDELPFLYFGICGALVILGLSLWFAHDFDLLAASQAEARWDAAFGAPVDRTTPLVPDSTEIVMQRAGCEGWCPVYEVRIRSDGQVHFYGDRFVCAFGDRTASVDPYVVRHLIRAMQAAHFGQIATRRSQIVDARSTTLLLVSEHRVTGAVYEDGDDDALIEMGERVDELAGTYRWLPIVTATGRECPRASGIVRFR